MILKLEVHVEVPDDQANKTGFLKPDLEYWLRNGLTDSINMERTLKSFSNEYWTEDYMKPDRLYRDFIRHCKSGKIKILTHTQVLEKMRKG